MPTLVVIPAYNEAGCLEAVIAELRAAAPDLDILVVDDASADGTAALLPTLGVRWIRMPHRVGTGIVVRTGLRYGASLGFDTIVRIDGDGQHPPEAIAPLLQPLRDGRADVVIGSRYASEQTAGTKRLRRTLHNALGRVISLVTGQRVTDATSGFWAFGPRALCVLTEHHPVGYPEPELLLFLSRNGLRLVEVPVTMRDRLAGRTSLTLQRTGAALARLLLLLVVVPLRAVVHVRD